MSIKKTLVAAAAMAFAMMAFASSAMAGEGQVTDVDTGEPPTNGYVTSYQGWASFSTGSRGVECHVKSKTESTNNGKGGKVTEFEVDGDTHTVCVGTGEFAGCTIDSVEPTNEPWDLTVNTTDFVVSDPSGIVIHNELSGDGCNDSELTFSEITLEPLETTKNGKATNTNGNIEGDTTEQGDPIAGVEISGNGTAHIGPFPISITAEGELEVQGEDLCTWKLD